MSDCVMVAGAGRSGIAATKMLLEIGGSVVLYDSNPALDVDSIMANFPGARKLTVKKGDLHRSDVDGISLCVISPGIDLSAPFVKVLDDARIPIWSEIQLAFQKEKGTLVAITGTNGKTTTTALTGEIIKKKYEETFVLGNIGVPYTTSSLKTSPGSVTVLETSSFQLETITDFRPHVSAILNITPDHLNRHHTMENYIAVKESITSNQTEEDFCILNYDDPVLNEFGHRENLKPQIIWFSSTKILDKGYYLNGEYICRKMDGPEERIMSIRELNIIGNHNYENAMAAIAMAACMEVPMKDIVKAATEFKAVEHRIEFVLERAGVKYYNDSKGTNTDASIRAIASMPGPVVLIAGGYDKGSEYDDWVKTFKGKVKYVVLIGQTRDKIADCCKKYEFENVMYAETLDEAVKVAASYSDMGDCVLLSPACASWGMFKNYEERGKLFKEYVKAL